MVYKKYIKRNGKVFGPYYYESYRENGKVKTRFVSGPKKEDFFKNKIKDKRNYFIFVIFILILIGLFGLAFYYSDKIEKRIYDTGLLSPPYGDDIETSKKTQISEEEFQKELRQIVIEYSFEEILDDSFIKNLDKKETKKNLEFKKISNKKLEIYDKDISKDKPIATITKISNGIDIDFK